MTHAGSARTVTADRRNRDFSVSAAASAGLCVAAAAAAPPTIANEPVEGRGITLHQRKLYYKRLGKNRAGTSIPPDSGLQVATLRPGFESFMLVSVDMCLI